MRFELKCDCGTLRGHVEQLETANRGICYCRDCQAFIRYLGRESDVLDSRCGTEVFQMQPKHVRLTQGLDALASVRLTDKGLRRWYARCCMTPVGNTPPGYKLSFCSLIRRFLDADEDKLARAVGPVRMHVHTKSACGEPKPDSTGVAGAVLRFMVMLARARLDGSYRQTPFFNAADGTPVVRAKVLSPARLRELKYPG
ncbi:MAG TPA: DUF6151 family protein [Arenicellales bacterium]|nr:DUF6151 family protein [Arenicellales bacterium]